MRQRLATLIVGCLVLAGALVGSHPFAVAARDDRDAAWAAARGRFPAGQPLPRPTWLPERFRRAGGRAVDSSLESGVVYVSDAGERLLFGRTGNACALPAGDTSQLIEPVLIQGARGELVRNARPDCFPRIGAYWREGDVGYSIQANPGPTGAVVSRAEMLFIIAGLAATLPDGAPAPTPLLRGRPDGLPFRETGQRVAGPFREYWQANGGLAINGYPLTGEMLEELEDGQIYQVQYFERVRLEFHPEHAGTPHEILLGQFGRRILAGVPGAPTVPVAAAPGYTHFAETGHNAGPRFAVYWRANGGLAQFGLPLTELFEERLEDGKVYQVQYFERARFELHPENPAPYDVLLGQFGRRILAGSAPRALALEPAAGPCPTSVTVRGSGFAPDVATRFTIRRDRDVAITAANTSAGGRPIAADGTYATTLQLVGCGPDEPIGSTFTITVHEYYRDRAPTQGPGASAIFTVTAL